VGWWGWLWSACSRDEADQVEPPSDPNNVLIVIIDDVGIDKIASYGVGVPAPPTPTIDGLAARGVKFHNAWSYPTCSPARGALLTGRHARRFGIGDWIQPWEDPARLAEEEVTLPEMLRHAGTSWDSSLVGKWHLTSFMGDRDSILHGPGRQGFAWHGGGLGNLDNVLGPGRPDNPGYYRWEKDTNGVLSIETEYVTVATTDDGIARMQAMSEPWLMLASYNAVHTPLAPPPAELVPELTSGSDVTLYDAILMATDREIGRLLDALPAHTTLPTTIVVVSDNGTPIADTHPSLEGRGGKGSPYELGVRVPLVVVSPLVQQPGRSDALVHVVDLFATVAELADVDLSEVPGATGAPLVHDSVSLVPYLLDPAAPSQRELMYSEAFWPNGPPPYEVTKAGVRSATLKYVRNRGSEELYPLGPDGLEGGDLLLAGPLTAEQEQALAEMRAYADEHMALPFDY
jgi:arylsulfatase B